MREGDTLINGSFHYKYKCDKAVNNCRLVPWLPTSDKSPGRTGYEAIYIL